MKQIIVCGCGKHLEFEREVGHIKNVDCPNCRASFKSDDKGYVYTGQWAI